MLKKDTLIKGTLILAAAALVARVLGLIQRVPLQYYLGDYGMALYGIAYNIYFALLIVATAGIPSALSKLVADRLALGREREARLIYRAAVRFAIAAGVLMTALLYVLAPLYANHVAHVPESALAIRALAPALLLFPLIAIMRGYFQGRQMMTAGGISQIFEQILRVLTAVLLAVLLITFGYTVDIAAAGASFGGVLGSVAAFLVMLYYARKLKNRGRGVQLAYVEPDKEAVADSVDLPGAQGPLPSTRSIYAQMFKLSVPISLVAIIVPAIYFIDSSIVVPLIQSQLAGGVREAQEILGILVGRAQSFAGIPPILAIALSTSIIPIISAAYAKRDVVRLQSQASLALRMALLAGLPLVVMLTVAARSYNIFLFGDDRGTWIIAALTASALFQVMMMTGGSILMGLGQPRRPMIHVALGIIVKLLFSFLLATWWGIYGIVAATALAFLLILLLNLQALRKHVAFVILGHRWWGLMITTLLLVAVGVFCEWTTTEAGFPAWIRALLNSSVLAACYPLLLAYTGVVRKSDLQQFPQRLQMLSKKLKFDRLLRG